MRSRFQNTIHSKCTGREEGKEVKMGCVGSTLKQQQISTHEQCSCSVNRKLNLCPVHVLNSLDNVIDDYKEDDLNNERRIYERKKEESISAMFSK